MPDAGDGEAMAGNFRMRLTGKQNGCILKAERHMEVYTCLKCETMFHSKKKEKRGKDAKDACIIRKRKK